MRRGRPSLNAAEPRLLLVTTTWGKFAGLAMASDAMLVAPVNEDAAVVVSPVCSNERRAGLPPFRPRSALILPIGYVRDSPSIKPLWPQTTATPPASPGRTFQSTGQQGLRPPGRSRLGSSLVVRVCNSVAKTGLEPVRPCGRRILNPLRLPIPPLRLVRVSPADSSASISMNRDQKRFEMNQYVVRGTSHRTARRCRSPETPPRYRPASAECPWFSAGATCRRWAEWAPIRAGSASRR
jgi:hypothetical protein